jgi:putative hydrolase of HD superfamily
MNKKITKEKKIAQFLYEIGTMRKLPRMHQQMLLSSWDMSDNIAAHSHRVTFIGWFLAKMENVDPYKVVMMCLTHDMDEIRTGDHNWVHKRYIKIFEEEILKEQLGTLPFSELEEFALEYKERNSKEAIVAKDADLIDQILLLKEYIWQGNKEAVIWLGDKKESIENKQFKFLKTKSAIKIAKAIVDESPSNWWHHLSTNKNR